MQIETRSEQQKLFGRYYLHPDGNLPSNGFLVYFSVGTRFEIKKPRGLCIDIGKKVIDNLAECEDAAIELGGHVNKHWTNGVPKGCSSRWGGDFVWNKYKGIETSRHRHEFNRAICTKRGS